MNKTNALRQLDKLKIHYEAYEYDKDRTLTAGDVAKIFNRSENSVFKTLVTVGKSGKNYVFVIPANKNLDLKEAAKAANEKSINMIKEKDLLPLTGYVHGGCSPIGMKKAFPTYIDSSASEMDNIMINGGSLGLQIVISPNDIMTIFGFNYF